MNRTDSARPMAPDVVIHGGRLYWPGRDDAAMPEPVLEGPTRIERIRNAVLLLTVFGYLLFNWGFQQIRVPPVAGGGLPIGEIVLFMALLTISYTRTLGRLNQVVWLLPFAIWWGFGLGRAMVDFSMYGTWALRDAVHVIESLFLLAGFVLAAHPSTLEKFFHWLPRFLVVAVAYGCLYPFQWEIWMMSPTIMGANGFEVAIIGSMMTMPFLMIMSATYLMLYYGNRLLPNVVAVLMIGFAVATFQARTLYLVLIAVFAFLVWYRRSTVGSVVIFVYVSGLLLAIVSLVGLQFQGRLGTSFDFNFLIAHFMAIFGYCPPGQEAVCAAAEGVGQRLDWWQDIFARMMANPYHLLLGLGYGVPLTEFYGNTGVLVREPHNSYISVIARTGVIGALAWVAMMVLMVRAWHRTFRHTVEIGWREGQNRLLLLMVYFISMWVLAIGEDGFEKPYNIIPFYFFWGVVLRMGLLLERGEIGPDPEDDDEPPVHPYLEQPLSLRYR